MPTLLKPLTTPTAPFFGLSIPEITEFAQQRKAFRTQGTRYVYCPKSSPVENPEPPQMSATQTISVYLGVSTRVPTVDPDTTRYAIDCDVFERIPETTQYRQVGANQAHYFGFRNGENTSLVAAPDFSLDKVSAFLTEAPAKTDDRPV